MSDAGRIMYGNRRTSERKSPEAVLLGRLHLFRAPDRMDMD